MTPSEIAREEKDQEEAHLRFVVELSKIKFHERTGKVVIF